MGNQPTLPCFSPTQQRRLTADPRTRREITKQGEPCQSPLKPWLLQVGQHWASLTPLPSSWPFPTWELITSEVLLQHLQPRHQQDSCPHPSPGCCCISGASDHHSGKEGWGLEGFAASALNMCGMCGARAFRETPAARRKCPHPGTNEQAQPHMFPYTCSLLATPHPFSIAEILVPSHTAHALPFPSDSKDFSSIS